MKIARDNQNWEKCSQAMYLESRIIHLLNQDELHKRKSIINNAFLNSPQGATSVNQTIRTTTN